jgi:hypothetical protein
MWRPDVVVTSACFVKIVVEVRTRRHEAVDTAVGDEVRDDESQSTGAQGACHPEKDRHIVGEHLLPHAVCRRKVPTLERDALHPREDLVGRQVRVDDERLDRRVQEARLLLHARPIITIEGGTHA